MILAAPFDVAFTSLPSEVYQQLIDREDQFAALTDSRAFVCATGLTFCRSPSNGRHGPHCIGMRERNFPAADSWYAACN